MTNVLALIHIHRLPCNRNIYRLISSKYDALSFPEQKQKLHRQETAVFDYHFFRAGRGGSLAHWAHCVGPTVLSLLCWANCVEPTMFGLLHAFFDKIERNSLPSLLGKKVKSSITVSYGGFVPLSAPETKRHRFSKKLAARMFVIVYQTCYNELSTGLP